MSRETCVVCAGRGFTTANFTDRYRVALPGGGSVHFRCLPRWLIDDALLKAFPGATPRELELMSRRLRLHPDDLEAGDLRLLDRVAKQMGWTTGRASQVQRDAMRRFRRFVREREAGPSRPRRELSFVALGESGSGFRAADAEEILEKELGSWR